MTTLASIRIKIKRLEDDLVKVKEEFNEIVKYLLSKQKTHPLGEKKE